MLHTKQLSKIYKDAPGGAVIALDGIDLNVKEGEFVCIMGASGSGKSTLLHLLGGLDKPTSGEIYISETALHTLSDNDLTLLRRSKIGFVFQFFNLLPSLNVCDNILLPVIIANKKISDYTERLEYLLKWLGLDKRREHYPDTLSGGEQQRVAIARALLIEPLLIFADEPTGNLDSKTNSEILQLLYKSCKELKQTILMATHNPAAASFADRILFLKDGKIIGETLIKNQNIIEDKRGNKKNIEFITDWIKTYLE